MCCWDFDEVYREEGFKEAVVLMRNGYGGCI